MSARSRSPTDGRSAARIRVSSIAIRSPERWADERGRRADRLERRRLDREPERRREPDRAEDPQRVLLEPGSRLADGADPARGDVGAAAVRDRARRGRGPPASAPTSAPQAIAFIVKSRRARSASIESRELDPVRPPEVGVVVVAPERRDLVVDAVAPDATVPNRFS